MPYTVSQLLTDAARGISPANPADSRDVLGAVGEAARNVLAQVNPKDLSRRVEIENALYDQVFRFKCPEDLSNQAIAQWFRFGDNHGDSGDGSQRNADTFYHPMKQVSNRRFDQHRHYDKHLFTIEWQSGVKFIKVSDFHANHSRVTINQMDSLTANGTWNVFGNVVNLTTDNLNYVSGNGSLRMNINTSATSGGIESYDITPVDISSYFVQGKVFTWLDLPNLNQVQSVTLDLFSSLTDYFSMTVNSPHDTNQFQLGWNLLGFSFDNQNMTTVGTPNPSAITGIRITIVTNGTLLMNNVRIDNIVMRRGAAYGIQYVSEYMFEDAQTGIWSLVPTDPSNIIHVQGDTYKLLLAETTSVLGQELFTGKARDVDIARVDKKRDEAFRTYKKSNKEEYIVEQQEPYRWGVPFGYGYNDGSGHDHHAPITPP